jgi:hypothetical protein
MPPSPGRPTTRTHRFSQLTGSQAKTTRDFVTTGLCDECTTRRQGAFALPDGTLPLPGSWSSGGQSQSGMITVSGGGVTSTPFRFSGIRACM